MRCLSPLARRPGAAMGTRILTYVMAAAEEIAQAITGYAVIVTKSTVPVGTNRQVKQTVSQGQPKGCEFDVAINPEFLREGRGD